MGKEREDQRKGDETARGRGRSNGKKEVDRYGTQHAYVRMCSTCIRTYVHTVLYQTVLTTPHWVPQTH